MTPGDWVSLAVHLAAGGTLAVIARDLLKVNERVERCEQHAEQDDRRDRHLASECAQLRDELDRAQKKLAVLWLERKAQELTPNGWGDDERAGERKALTCRTTDRSGTSRRSDTRTISTSRATGTPRN